MTINVQPQNSEAAISNIRFAFFLNINYHQCPLIVPLILFMSISKEKINVSKLMFYDINGH